MMWLLYGVVRWVCSDFGGKELPPPAEWLSLVRVNTETCSVQLLVQLKKSGKIGLCAEHLIPSLQPFMTCCQRLKHLSDLHAIRYRSFLQKAVEKMSVS